MQLARSVGSARCALRVANLEVVRRNVPFSKGLSCTVNLIRRKVLKVAEPPFARIVVSKTTRFDKGVMNHVQNQSMPVV